MTKKFLIVMLVIFFLSSCSIQKNDNYQLLKEFRINSLRTMISSLNKEAQKWNKDSYLTFVFISFDNKGGKSITDAVYHSPNSENIDLSIWMNEDGLLSKDQVINSDSTNYEIKNSDWLIDSIDLLKYAIKNKDFLEFLKLHSDKICGFMRLESIESEKTKIIWRLAISDCKLPINSIQIEIDPKTGAILGN